MGCEEIRNQRWGLIHWVGRWTWRGSVQCLRYTTRLLKGFFFPFTLMRKFYFWTLVLPQMDGWMADHCSEMLSECPLSISFFAIGQATMLEREGFTAGCTHVNNHYGLKKLHIISNTRRGDCCSYYHYYSYYYFKTLALTHVPESWCW